MSVILTETASTLIKDAFILLGVIDADEVLSADLSSLGIRFANRMIKAWQENEWLWKMNDETITLTPGTQSYTVGPGGGINRVRPLRPLYAVRRTSGIDIPIDIISKQEYQDLPSKTTQGPTVKLFYDKQQTFGVLYPWYTGDTTNNTIIVTFADPLDLLDSTTDTFDFPDEAIEALLYNLTMRLGVILGVPVSQEISLLAINTLENLKSFDAETASIRFMPRAGYGR